MAGFLSNLLAEWQHQIDRHRNRPFLEATMAACALVAIADGEVSLGERIRVDQIIDTLDALKVFDPHEAVDLFNGYAEAIRAAPREGRERAVAAVKAVADDRDTAALLIRICVAIAEAHAGKQLVDQIEIVMLCSLLGVTPGECGLYTDHGPEHILDEGAPG